MSRRLKRMSVATAAATALVLPMLATPAFAAPPPVVVSNGLNNPRQLSLTSDNVLLVAEAGSGGTTCASDPMDPESKQCVGKTGSVTAITDPVNALKQKPNRVITGLLSGAGPDGSFAVGGDGVSMRTYKGGTIWMQITTAPPDVFPAGLVGPQSGKLLYAFPNRTPQVASDVGAFSVKNDVDGQGPDSNPYAVLDTGQRRLVADAAANAVFSVARDGKITLFHAFGNITSEDCTRNNGPESPGYDPTPEFPGCNYVPTSLAETPAGNILVGGLASEAQGQGTVTMLSPTGKVLRTWTGFTGVTGVAMGLDSNLYVSQLFAQQHNPPVPDVVGVVTRVKPDGGRDNLDVPFPAGLAVDKGNNVYVSAWSVASAAGLAGPGTEGQVWKVRF